MGNTMHSFTLTCSSVESSENINIRKKTKMTPSYSYLKDLTGIDLKHDISSGKQVIHPNQIAVVQEQFSPSPEKIKWAEELIAAFKEHQQLGKKKYPLVEA
ncbi:hypothetical protein P7K49_000228 [Saguinus oedipus]|uniref:Uncharacterized protein n=1 Tax=Saguinus oedipus TaxID=9490 RepID=A0ABQ9WB55_SAGOE|nr:hypothetical protein P7K49_000228 [Saguinus oedipus]